MIVCSCNAISCRDIADVVDALILDDPSSLMTPAQIYRALDKRPRCGGCLAHAAELVAERTACLREARSCTCKHRHKACATQASALVKQVEREHPDANTTSATLRTST